MTSSALGIPITIAAAFCQNQKQLRGQFSTNGSAFTRYAFGSPVVVLYVVGLHVIAGLPGPKANVAFLAWVVLGSG